MKIANTNNVKLNQSADKKISIALMASYAVLTVQYFILITFDLLGSSGGAMVQFLSKGLVGLFFLYALPVVIKKRFNLFLGVYFVVTFVFVLHFLFFPENRIYLREISFSFFFICIPAFVYSMCLADWNVLYKVMKKVSWIVFAFGMMTGIQIVLGGVTAGTYSMALSYYILLPAILFIDEFFDRFSLKALLGAFLSVLVILALGSRGAILCIAIFMILKMIRPKTKLRYKNILFNVAILVSTILVFLNLEPILVSLNDFLLKFDINSRSLMIFLNEDIHLSGREDIYQYVLGEMADHPLFGVGLGGDRVAGLGYSHNLFLELGANFGVIIGGILSIILMILLLHACFLKDHRKSHMVMIWLCLGFVHLMVSGSYLTEMKFWILLGLVIHVLFLTSKRTECIHAQKVNLESPTGVQIDHDDKIK